MNLSKILNIAAYKFVTLGREELSYLRTALKETALALELKGTVLLSTEGINLILAASPEKIKNFQNYLCEIPQFSDLTFKESFSEFVPFSRLLVRLKKEIISMGVSSIKPEQKTAPYITPQQLKAWYEQNKEMIVLDTRNTYEVVLGGFDQAQDLNIRTFREFSQAINTLPDQMKEKPVVTYCTGGIRCEKAAALLLEQGFKEVYQLQGGILNYLEQCGGSYYHGECFVFDDRIGLNANLETTGAKLCNSCQTPLTLAHFKASNLCPHCLQSYEEKR